MKWDLIRPALASLVATCAGFTNQDAVAWKGSSRAGIYRAFPRVELQVRTVRTVGRDEIRRTPAANPNVNDDVVTVSGVREITLGVRIESIVQTDDKMARIYADRLVARIRRTSSGAALREVGLSFQGAHPIAEIQYTDEGRELSVAVADLVLNGVENDLDDTDGAGDWIETVQIRSNTLDGESGAPLAKQVNAEITR